MNYQSLQTFSQVAIAAGLIIAAIGGYGVYYFGKKHDEIKSAYDKILITPPEIILPAHASRSLPITITNNFPYPVFMVVVEITVLEGDIDLSKDFIPFGNGIWQSKYVSCQIDQINSRGVAAYIWNIDGSQYSNSSKIKLSIVGYLKEPSPNFILHGIDSFLEKIEFPEGFIPPINENK